MVEPTKDDWRKAAEAEYYQRRGIIIRRIETALEAIQELRTELERFQHEIEQLDAAASVFGLSVSKTPEAAQLKLVGHPVKATITKTPLYKDVVLDVLKAAHPNRLKAAEVRETAEKQAGQKFHPKTTGMTLYRLAKDGLAQRDGHKWSYVPQEEGSDAVASEPQ